MARTVRDARLDTRAARLRLGLQSEPYWRMISEGCHLGYRRGIRGGRWVARFRPSGRSGGYNKASLGSADDYNDADGVRFLDYKQAQDVARRWFEDMARPRQSRTGYTVSQCLDDYLDAFTGKSLEKTRARANSAIRAELGTLQVADLTTECIEQWLRARAAAPAQLRTRSNASKKNVRPITDDEQRRRRRSTANRDLTVLKAALNCAFRKGIVPSDAAWRRARPFRGVDQPKMRFLNESEMRRLVNAVDEVIRPLVTAALLTSARYGELIALRVNEVDLANGTVHWLDTKSGKPRVSYLEEEGVRHFERLTAGKRPNALVFTRRDGTAWKPSQQGRLMRDACERAQIVPAAGFHDLRRSYGALLAKRGVETRYIAEAMGHADERITKRHYAHLAPSHVADTIRGKLGGLEIVPPSNVVAIKKR